MQLQNVAGAVVCVVAVVFDAVAAQLDFRRPEIVPAPREMTYKPSVPVRIDASTEFAVRCPDAAAKAWIKSKASKWFGAAVRTRMADGREAGVEAPHEFGGEEGYSLVANPGRIEIAANTIKGVRLAMYTLRQAAERESGGAELKGYWLPALKIRDEPALAFRGVHFCWFPECSPVLIERQIRFAAYCKFNYAVVECWGVFKSEKFPYLSLPDAFVTAKDLRRLSDVARDLGITLIPQLNVLGHAAQQRWCSGKHATLDFHPERQPLFEPGGGWNWCLSNPEAVKTVQGFVAELHDAFGRPPFFHIGCDEADPPTCPVCRAAGAYAGLIESHIVAIADLLRRRGARAMMWHDMLLERDKWKPFVAKGSGDEAKMVDTLPKDIVICDYYYGNDPDKVARGGEVVSVEERPTLDYFAGKGFSVLACPWRDMKEIVDQSKYVRERRLFGVLQTVWHRFRGLEFMQMMEAAASGAWGVEHEPVTRSGRPFAKHWRQIGWDMGVSRYEDAGFFDRQATRDILDR